MKSIRKLSLTIAAIPCLAAIAAFSGCENKEKVLDIETPSGEIEVERSKDTGEIEIETNEK